MEYKKTEVGEKTTLNVTLNSKNHQQNNELQGKSIKGGVKKKSQTKSNTDLINPRN